MTRNSARYQSPREAGVGLPPDAGAGEEEEFVPESIGPRRSQAGRLRKEKAPSARRSAPRGHHGLARRPVTSR